ncbi:MAG: hypothetical protein WBY53_15625 [Acidobacteriaceae bacterium]
MKTLQLFYRLLLLSAVAAIFIVLTALFATLIRPPSNAPHWKLHRHSAPQLSGFPELLGEGLIVALCTVAGRFVFRLRLSPPFPTERQPISPRPRRKASRQ